MGEGNVLTRVCPSVCPRGGGVSPAGGGGVSPAGGVSPGGGGGVSQDRTTEGVLATRRAVCLLCSRRRTFLLIIVIRQNCPVKSRPKKFLMATNGKYKIQKVRISKIHISKEFRYKGIRCRSDSSTDWETVL